MFCTLYLLLHTPRWCTTCIRGKLYERPMKTNSLYNIFLLVHVCQSRSAPEHVYTEGCGWSN